VRSILGFVTHNWKLKLAAFALAMLLWVTVTADQIAIRWLLVPIAVDVQDPNFQVIEGPIPAEVQVRISGPRREFWDLGMNRPQLRLELANLQEGTHTFTLDPQQVQIPRRAARGLTPIDVRPARVTLSLQRAATVQVPVSLQIAAGPQPEFALVDSLRVVPALIRVTGPLARVNTVAGIRTHPIDLSQAEGDFERTVPLDTVGLAGLVVSTREVTVSGRIERALQRVIPDVPVAAPAGVLVVPGAVTVELRGAESVVRGMTAASLRAVVPPESVPTAITEGGTDAVVRIERLPPGVSAVAEPSRVRVLGLPSPTTLPEIRPLPGAVPRPPEAADTVPDESEPDSDLR
jgi:hypothetical protein